MKTINLNLNDINVDAGMIIVSDVDYIKKYNPFNTTVYDVPVGNYKVKWCIPSSWNGRLSGTSELKVTSGKIVVVDPCYVIDDVGWSHWLTVTDYGRDIKSQSAFIIDSMGGDGVYNVELKLIEQQTK